MNDLQTLQTLFDGFTVNTNFLTVALLIGIVIDFITGIAKGYKADHKVSSSKLRDGGFKKAGILLVVGLGYGLSILFNDGAHVIFNGVQAYYIYTELVSIIENLKTLGVNMPTVLLKIIGYKTEGGAENESSAESNNSQ